LAFYKNVASNEVAYIYKSFQDTKIIGADVASASQVHTSTVVLLPIVKNWSVWLSDCIWWHKFFTKSHENQ